jgi:ABC-type uncharacterized transport system fused permease/ATPase subunit
MQDDLKAELKQKIAQSLERANRKAARTRPLNSALGWTGMGAGALATLFAAMPAATGTAMMGSGVEGWRLTCGVVAAITLLGTVATGLSQQLNLTDTVARAQACAARLNALDVALSLGTLQPGDAAARYTEIVAEYGSVLGS